MKINLNNYLICNKDYLTNINIKYNYKDEQYNHYMIHQSMKHSITSNNDLNIILLPYLYTLSRLNKSEYDYFKMFYFNYLDKSGLNMEYPYDSSVEFTDYIQKNIVLTITFIIAAQYYFL